MNLMNAQTLALGLMEDHGLLDLGWKFEFNNTRRQKGHCEWKIVNGVLTKTLRLSTHWTKVRDDADVRNTILHEIAHALAGLRAGHGALWKHYAIQVGAKPVRCTSDPEGAKAVGKYAVVCLGEGETLGYVSSTRFKTEGKTCRAHKSKIALLPNKDRVV